MVIQDSVENMSTKKYDKKEIIEYFEDMRTGSILWHFPPIARFALIRRQDKSECP